MVPSRPSPLRSQTTRRDEPLRSSMIAYRCVMSLIEFHRTAIVGRYPPMWLLPGAGASTVATVSWVTRNALEASVRPRYDTVTTYRPAFRVCDSGSVITPATGVMERPTEYPLGPSTLTETA